MRDSEMVELVCETLAERLGWAYRPDGPQYVEGEIAVFYGPIGEAPGEAVGVTLYNTEDELATGLKVRRVQLMFRGAPGAPAAADDLADAAFDTLQGLSRHRGLSLVSRVVMARLGADENSRQERADSYQIILDNVEATA